MRTCRKLEYNKREVREEDWDWSVTKSIEKSRGMCSNQGQKDDQILYTYKTMIVKLTLKVTNFWTVIKKKYLNGISLITTTIELNF